MVKSKNTKKNIIIKKKPKTKKNHILSEIKKKLTLLNVTFLIKHIINILKKELQIVLLNLV